MTSSSSAPPRGASRPCGPSPPTCRPTCRQPSWSSCTCRRRRPPPATILGRAGPLPATHAADIQPLPPGTLLVAPPDRHLLVDDDGARLTRGPRENGHRPAVDPLFRSAARAHGNRVVGVVLSGALDDGSAGLGAIKFRHGVTVVQDPDEALYDAMPRNAIEAAAPDHVLPLAGIAALLGRLAREEPAEPVAPVGPELRLETDMTALDPDVVHADDRPGQPSPFSCPDCSGVLFELQEGRLHRFRCRVSHACPRTGVAARQAHGLEGALWAALRSLEEKTALTRRLAERAVQRGARLSAERFWMHADDDERRAELIREVLLAGDAKALIGGLGD